MEQNETKKALPARHHFDFAFFAVVMAICAFGLVMLYSASYYYAMTKFGSGSYFIKRQLLFFGLGLAFMIGLSYVKFTVWQRLAPFAYIGVLVILLATLIWGERINEATRWIKIFGIQFQPSEFAKLGLVMALAWLMCSGRVNMQSLVGGIVPCLAMLVPMAALIILQPNFSLVVILALITYVMLYLGGTRLSHRFLLVVIGIIAGVLILMLKGYRLQRIDAYFHPENDPSGASYQIIQSRIALGNGGFFGQGLNFSRQKLLFLPERESDYILAIIGEELGFFGCFLLISAYFFLVFRGMTIAMRCHDRFGRMLAGGVISVLAIQVLINVGVVSSALPSTGQTLPFVSYGGTSLMVFMAAMGILLNISRYTEVSTKNARRTKEKAE